MLQLLNAFVKLGKRLSKVATIIECVCQTSPYLLNAFVKLFYKLLNTNVRHWNKFIVCCFFDSFVNISYSYWMDFSNYARIMKRYCNTLLQLLNAFLRNFATIIGSSHCYNYWVQLLHYNYWMRKLFHNYWIFFATIIEWILGTTIQFLNR